jgi:hypothetical protein
LGSKRTAAVALVPIRDGLIVRMAFADAADWLARPIPGCTRSTWHFTTSTSAAPRRSPPPAPACSFWTRRDEEFRRTVKNLTAPHRACF